ncbi:hypothetical protein PM3016_6218 [Paenibacillus mucilaginosus 3016]|uniref:Uncharacterized protein n=2 Tax=Paenibacillus mucilaginosus TaxID=61624 RepID=H6NRX1_9BACL|nr:hypothetical protein PM3016_6218 [Paenibacillus mucilaginosus 3016]
MICSDCSNTEMTVLALFMGLSAAIIVLSYVVKLLGVTTMAFDQNEQERASEWETILCSNDGRLIMELSKDSQAPKHIRDQAERKRKQMVSINSH